MAVFVGVSCVVAIYALIEANWIAVRRHTLEFSNLPMAFDGYRIVFASDFHVRFIGPRERKALQMLEEHAGDLLVLGGDYQLQRHASPRGGMAFVDVVSQLADLYTDGIVAVRGNHDRSQMRRHLQKQTKIRYMRKSNWVLARGGAKIGFSGARCKPGEDCIRARKEVRRMAGGFGPDVRFRILIAHWPDYFLPAVRRRYDLVLSGDTHGGQIRLPFVGLLVNKSEAPRRYAYGLHRKGRSTLYTTSGIGTRTFPFRLLCRPEVVIFEMKRMKAEG